MISFLRPPHRSSGGSTVPTLSSAVVTILGLRVTRNQILRVSGLLVLRSLSGLVEIPLDDSVQTYIWQFLFSSAQAGVALATAASFFNFGSTYNNNNIFSNIVGRFIPSSVDEPFVNFYAVLVLALGPIIACLESVVIIYEIMNVSRKLEYAMFKAEESGGKFLRPTLLSISISALVSVSAIAYYCTKLTESWIIGALPIGCVSILLLIISGITTDANVIESSFIALYVAGLWLIAMMEEAILGGTLIKSLNSRDVKQWASGDDMRAAVLVCSLLMLLVSMGRVERFLKVIALGHDSVEEQERQQASLGQSSSSDPNNDSTQQQGDDGSKQDTQMNNNQRYFSPARKYKMRPAISAVTLIGATFRVLMWAQQIGKGEYLPVPCRGWQLLMSVILYIVYVRSD